MSKLPRPCPAQSLPHRHERRKPKTTKTPVLMGHVTGIGPLYPQTAIRCSREFSGTIVKTLSVEHQPHAEAKTASPRHRQVFFLFSACPFRPAGRGRTGQGRGSLLTRYCPASLPGWPRHPGMGKLFLLFFFITTGQSDPPPPPKSQILLAEGRQRYPAEMPFTPNGDKTHTQWR